MNSNFLQPHLFGESLSLRPLLQSDFDNLYIAASDPLIWAGHPSPLRYQKDEFIRWFDEAIASTQLVVTDNASGKILGSSRYYEHDQEKSEIAIGFTFLIREVWGGATNRELKTLMLEHAFTQVKMVWFHVDITNIRSQVAMKKIGAIESHTAEKSIRGKVSRYVFFKIERPF